MAIIKRPLPQPQPQPQPQPKKPMTGSNASNASNASNLGAGTPAPERYEELAKLAEQKREERRKQVLTLRVSAETMNKARALGTGYTGILSRLLEAALDDPDMIEKCL